MLMSIEQSEVEERLKAERQRQEDDVEAVFDQIGASRLYDESGYGTSLGVVRACTPERASEFLKLIPSYQRAIDRGHVARIRDAMERGRYVSGNGSVIGFARDCSVVDGQHRLTAQVEAGVTLDLVVCVVGDEAFATIDATNKPRSVRDLAVIQSHGKVRLAPSLISALVWDRLLEGGDGTRRFEHTQKAERALMVLEHPQRELCARLYADARAPKPTAGLLVGAMVCERVGGRRAEVFFRDAFRNDHTSSPAKTLALWIVGGRRTSVRTLDGVIIDERDRAIHAWNAYAQGRELHVLKGTTAGVSPRPVRWGSSP